MGIHTNCLMPMGPESETLCGMLQILVCTTPNVKHPTLPHEGILSCVGYSDCTLLPPLASTNVIPHGYYPDY